MPPRSVSSNPNLVGSRKGSVPSLYGAASSSTESLPSSTHTAIPVRMTSVMQRARAFDQRAATDGASMTPRTSPPPISPFKTNVIGPFSIPQATARRPVAAHGSESATALSPSGDRTDSIRLTNAHEMTIEEVQPVSIDHVAGLAAEKPQPAAASEGSGEDDEDETPRQSTAFNTVPTKISRQDSSRDANYSLKARTYAPDLSRGERRSEPTTIPQLPKLYFESSEAPGFDNEPTEKKFARSHFSSPQTDISRVGWPGEADSGVDEQQSQPGRDTRPVQTPPPSDDQDVNSRTFFWHSPHDSTDETDDDPDEDDDEAEVPAPLKPVPKNAQGSLTSATALGFGGPSDWEHFYVGDYSTSEVVDDTNLYVSKKEQGKAGDGATANSNVDLSGGQDKAPEAETQLDAGTSRPAAAETRTWESPQLPTIQEHQEIDESNIITQHIDYEANLDDFARSPPPMTPAVSQGSAFPNESYRIGVDSVVGVANQRLPKENQADAQENGHANGMSPSLDAADRTSRQASLAPTENSRDGESPSRTPPPPELRMPPNKFNPTDLSSGPSSPSADDPNASEITISMVVTNDFDTSVLPPREDVQAINSPPLRVADSRKSVFPQGDELPNPYAGLTPIAKSSLNRFIRMLREEEKAEVDRDKYYTFVNFMRHELKLRATLYDMDEEPEISVPSSVRQSIVGAAGAAGAAAANGETHPGPTQRKPLPIPPDGLDSQDPTIGRAQSILASHASASVQIDPSVSTGMPLLDSILEGPSVTGIAESMMSSGDVQAQAADGESADKSVEPKSSLERLNRSIDLVAPQSSIIVPSPPPTSVPQLSSDADSQPSAAASPLPASKILEHSLSVRSSEIRPYDGDKATNRQSIYRPFSGMLRSSSSQRRASMDSISTVRSTEKSMERKTTDSTSTVTAESITTPKSAATTGDVSTPTTLNSSNEKPAPAGQQTPPLDPLLAVVPKNNILREEHRQLAGLRFDMDNIVDDFSFIHKTVLAWDSGAKIKRDRYELERQQRMSENERRVDELFNDNEIGYSDISHLEDDFKRSESAKKAEEEREEVESFVSSVFDVVWARINYEMDRLTPLYQEATRLVSNASAGRHMFEETDERVPIAPIMEILLILYQKLMIRHQKAFEAVLERDRRLKKTEVSPWFGIGQFDKVKRIEKRFEDAEKKAILEFCRQRDERANQLMDVLDQHTLRGVGANQDYMESVMQAVRKVSLQLATRGGSGGGSDGEREEAPRPSHDDVIKAKLVTGALARSSEQIVRTFHVADMLLNAADYEVSVANAKLSNADGSAFKRLRDAKAKEDAKLAADLEHRLGLIRSDTSRTNDEVVKLMLLNGQHDGEGELKFDLGKEKDRRMLAALDAARKRISSQPPTPPEK